MKPIKEAIDKRGFAGADFAGEGDKALAGLNAIHQSRQGFLDLFRQIEKARIGIDVERIFFELEEAFVHGTREPCVSS